MDKHVRHGLIYILSFALLWMATPALIAFALYFWGLRRFGHTALRYPWALTVGLTMGLLNVTWNLLSSLIFLRLPVWRNESGALSPFFTTRLKAYRRDSYAPILTGFLIAVISFFDPDHFGGA